MALHPITIDTAGGEYMDSVLVVDWAKAPGDPVAKGDLLLTVETAKAATEIEADRDGWLAGIAFAEGTEAPVGAVLGHLTDVEGDTASDSPEPDLRSEPAPPVSAARANDLPLARGRIVASPLARRLAAQKAVDLGGVTGTGPGGRIKARDVDRALRRMPAPAVVPGGTAGATLVLLHGFGADKTAWRQVRALMPRGIRTVAPDLPGHGGQAATPGLSLEDIAADLSARIEALGIEEMHLAGHSLGGAAALALAASGRQVVRSLTLIAPAGLGPEMNRGFVAGLTEAETPEALDFWLGQMVADAALLPEGFAEAVLAQMARQGTRVPLQRMARNLFPGGRPAFDLTATLSATDVPLRLIWGREDNVLPPALADRAPDHAALHLLRGVGHVPPLEAPALVARILGETILGAG
ncbi:alpha/beta fold hydrolase [Salipiger sp.]|uniref:alpha/beta fold hydrolase n=1 Tax=Salipiger sp. TaxID=2078585 RepID=UPI003A968F2B